MNEETIIKEKEKHELKKSKKQFSKLVTISLIMGIIIISGFIIFYLISPEPGYYSFVVLNEEKKMEDYETNATVGETIYFYVGVENQLNRPLTFQVEILKGDNETQLGPGPTKYSESYYNITEITLQDSKRWISNKLNISFSSPGNRTIIMELWETELDKKVQFLKSLWLRINVTI